MVVAVRGLLGGFPADSGRRFFRSGAAGLDGRLVHVDEERARPRASVHDAVRSQARREGGDASGCSVGCRRITLRCVCLHERRLFHKFLFHASEERLARTVTATADIGAPTAVRLLQSRRTLFRSIAARSVPVEDADPRAAGSSLVDLCTERLNPPACTDGLQARMTSCGKDAPPAMARLKV